MDNTEGEVDKDVARENVDEGLPKSHDELSQLIAAKKMAERDRVTRQMEAKYQAEIEQLKSQQKQTQAPARDANVAQQSPAGLNQSQIDEMVAAKISEDLERRQAEAAKEAHEEEMKRVANTYFSKLRAAGEKNSDIEEVMGDFDHTQFPQLVHAIHTYDNMGEMMAELANNPLKLEKINAWLKYSPKKAQSALQELSDSIRETSNAYEDYQAAPAPLSESRPSNVGVTSGMSKLEQLKRDRRYMF